MAGELAGGGEDAPVDVLSPLDALDELGATCESPRALEVNLVFDDGEGSIGATGRLLRLRDGREVSWVVLGASRGEAGILGEGIRQALLRDPTYGPALEAAASMLAPA